MEIAKSETKTPMEIVKQRLKDSVLKNHKGSENQYELLLTTLIAQSSQPSHLADSENWKQNIERDLDTKISQYLRARDVNASTVDLSVLVSEISREISDIAKKQNVL